MTFIPARAPRTFARNMLAGGGIVACRDAPTYIANRRSLVAGIAIYCAVALVLLLVVVIGAGFVEGR